ncbi:MAG TPA: PIN domain-containing protein [Anaerolineae bacterium]|nr:PIN domain-containing protein [Anaerolineae bacterium]
MTSYLLDTNHAVKMMAGEEPVSSQLAGQSQEGDWFYISMTVLAELFFAAYASSRREHNLSRINYLLERVILLDFDSRAAEEYGRVRAELKTKGRPIPGTDAQIAAVARLHGLTVLTADRHFHFVDGVTTANWLEGENANVDSATANVG